VIEPLMMGGDTPWILYMVGAIFALILNWLGVPTLAFCLGMFIPLQLNAPMLVGGAISWFVSHSSKDKEVSDARQDRGTLIASGLIAGGALFGVFAALTEFFKNPEATTGFAGFINACTPSHFLGAESAQSFTQIAGLVMYALLIIYLYTDAKRVKGLKK